MPNPAPIILPYASADANGGLPYLRPMNRWRLGCLVSLLFTVWVPFFTPWPLLAILGLPALLTCAVMTVIYIGRLCYHEVGTSYAVRHVLLALVLMPFFLLGIWIIPELI